MQASEQEPSTASSPSLVATASPSTIEPTPTASKVSPSESWTGYFHTMGTYTGTVVASDDQFLLTKDDDGNLLSYMATGEQVGEMTPSDRRESCGTYLADDPGGTTLYLTLDFADHPAEGLKKPYTTAYLVALGTDLEETWRLELGNIEGQGSGQCSSLYGGELAVTTDGTAAVALGVAVTLRDRQVHRGARPFTLGRFVGYASGDESTPDITVYDPVDWTQVSTLQGSRLGEWTSLLDSESKWGSWSAEGEKVVLVDDGLAILDIRKAAVLRRLDGPWNRDDTYAADFTKNVLVHQSWGSVGGNTVNTAYSLITGKQLWQVESLDNGFCMVTGGVVVVTANQQTVVLDVETGEQLYYSDESLCTDGEPRGRISYAGGEIYDVVP